MFTTFYNPPTAIHAIPKAPSQRIPVPQRRNGPSAGSLRDYSRLPHHPKHRKWTITPGVFLISRYQMGYILLIYNIIYKIYDPGLPSPPLPPPMVPPPVACGVGMLVCWYVGMLVCWYVGMLVCWYVGILVCWYVGMYVCR